MIKLSDIVEALEMTTFERDYYYNENDEDIFTPYFDYCEGEEEKEKIEDKIYDSIALPSKYDINEYQMMKDFTYEVEDETLRNNLLFALTGSGTFRKFKEICLRNGIIDKWHLFRNDAYIKLAIKWCEYNNIKYIDDSNK